MSRGELNINANTIYNSLRTHGLLHEVPLKENFGGDPWTYYKEHYDGVTKGKLHEIDHNLEYALKKVGLLDKLPLQRKGYHKRSAKIQ